jgi:hypothetical protein
LLAAGPLSLDRADVAALRVEAAPPTAADDDRLWTRVYPAVAQAPAIVHVEVFIESDEDNRAIEIVVDSGEYYRSSTIALEGARAARFHTVEYRALPVGTYDVLVGLQGRDGAFRDIQRRRLVITP